MAENYGWLPQIDTKALFALGEGLANRRQNNRMGEALGYLGSKPTLEAMAEALFKANPSVGLKTMIEARQAEALEAYRAAERDRPTHEMQNAEFFAGLPEGDPRKVYAPRSPSSRVLPRISINDLTEKGNAIVDSERLSSTFKDGYGGWKMDAAGHIGNYAARNLGIGNKDAALWWQDYQGYSNVVRNKLFGSALTVQEKAQWDRANINPGMTDESIRKNLELRKGIELRAARKLAKVYVRAGYDQPTIEEAIGFSLDEDIAPTENQAAPPPEINPYNDEGPSWEVDPAGRTVVPLDEAGAASLPNGMRDPAPKPKPEHVQKLQALLAQYPDPKDQAEIMAEWERKYPQYGRGAADHFLGRDVQAGR